MAGKSVHTEAEIKAASEDLLEWAKRHRGALAVAAMLGEDDGPVPAARAEAIVAGAVGPLNEAEIAVLLAQLDVAVLVMLTQMAAGAEMGEERFRRLVNTARREMLDAAGLDLCGECGGAGD
ncbi:MAG: hypothetical protein JJU44_13795 [Planctomycetes bacterium]|nr:hypothetical protein [Planctomycetota bacterium]